MQKTGEEFTISAFACQYINRSAFIFSDSRTGSPKKIPMPKGKNDALSGLIGLIEMFLIVIFNTKGQAPQMKEIISERDKKMEENKIL